MDENKPVKYKRGEVMLTKPGDNTEYIQHNLKVSELGAKRVDMAKPKAVAERAKSYFALCAENDMKPSVAGFALAFGVSRTQMWEYVNGRTQHVTEESREVLKAAYGILNAMMEDYMQNGKINPVAGIFLMKNNLNYEDKKEITVSPVDPLGSETPSEELRQKYLDAAKE